MYPVSGNSLPIKSWAEDDRPREKLLLKGPRALSDAELVAILLGSGTREESAVALARRLLGGFRNDLQALVRAGIPELTALRGVGPAKAVTLVAALELGRRRQLQAARELPFIGRAEDAYALLAPVVADLDHEQFWLLLLNRANKVLGMEQVSAGGITSTVVDPKVLFRMALQAQATALILCHNHPSGNLRPSPSDLDLTKQLTRAGQFLEITVTDHLIVTQGGYFSFAEEGLL